MSSVVVIGIGSNAGDATFNVQQAIEWLLERLSKASVSPVYQTEAFGKPDAAPYTNAVLTGSTDLPLDEFVASLKEYERTFGRDFAARANDIVPVDLDVVMWEGRILRPTDFSRSYFNIGYRHLVAEGAFEE